MHIITGAPGTNKTTKQVERMVREPGLYLFSNPTVDLITERHADLQRMAEAAGTKPLIVEVHGKVRSSIVRQVARAIADLPRDMQGLSHVIALVTHEGMISADLSGFVGWRAAVDEVLNRAGFAGGCLMWVMPPGVWPPEQHSSAPPPRRVGCCRSAQGGGGC